MIASVTTAGDLSPLRSAEGFPLEEGEVVRVFANNTPSA